MTIRTAAIGDEDLVYATPLEQLRTASRWVHRQTRVPSNLSNVAELSARQAVGEALTILKQSGIEKSVLWWEARRVGPKRMVSMRTVLLLLLAWQIQAPERDTNFKAIILWARDDLGVQNRSRIGLTHPGWYYDLFVAGFHSFVDLIDPKDSVLRIGDGGVIRERIAGIPAREVVLNALIAGSIPLAEETTPVLAIDSTDAESCSALLSQTKPNRSDGDDEYIPDGVASAADSNLHTFTVFGLDGRRVLAKDIEARCGYRTVVMGKRSKIFIGWDAHLLVDAGWYGAEHYVQYIRGMIFRPAGGHKGDAGIALIDSLDPRFVVDTIVADRGYSWAKAERWVRPLQERGITWVHDMHPAQKKRRTLMQHPTFNRHVMIDGTLFTDALPKRMWDLPGYHPAMTGAEKLALAAKYDERAQYAFVPNGNPRPDGKWQYRGPAQLGRVDCINAHPSRRINKGAPITNCEEGDGCWCDRNPLINAEDQLGLRQKYIYGTTKWLAYYGMRNASEAKNADLKENHGTLRRSSVRVNGTTANALLFAIRCCAINVASRHHGYQGEVPLTAIDPRTIPTTGWKAKRGTPVHRRNGPKVRPDARRASQQSGKSVQASRRKSRPEGSDPR
ncbi:hypothetical protein [Curtobacterium flaccumfaciens]|uniref:hypothetical protein n=1 Tax=Curtobacterium flaccumfaciens TaxID=2035 RepID=UPI00399686E2